MGESAHVTAKSLWVSESSAHAFLGSTEALVGRARASPDQVAIVAESERGALVRLRFQGASPFGAGICLEINGAQGDLVIRLSNNNANMLHLSDLRMQKTTGRGMLTNKEVPGSSYSPQVPLNAEPLVSVADTSRSGNLAILANANTE